MNIKEISIEVENGNNVDISLERRNVTTDMSLVEKAYSDYNFKYNEITGELELTLIANDKRTKTIKVDLPAEELVKDISYDIENKEINVEWQNGETYKISLKEFIDIYKADNVTLLLDEETKTFRINEEYLTASNIKVDSKKANVQATNVESAIEELKDDIQETSNKITKEYIGLGNVDNTSDLDKPISNATQLELNKKANSSDLKALAYKDSLNKSDVGLDKVNNVAITENQVSQIGSNKSDIDELKLKVGNLSGAFIFQGTLDSVLDLPTASASNKGYVYIVNRKEYASDGTQWVELGDEGSFVLKTTYESHLNTQKEKDDAQDSEIAKKADKTELFSKDYNDLSNKPTIPTKLSELEQDVELGVSEEDVMDIVENNAEQTDTLEVENATEIPIGTSETFNPESDEQIPTSKAVAGLMAGAGGGSKLYKHIVTLSLGNHGPATSIFYNSDAMPLSTKTLLLEYVKTYGEVPFVLQGSYSNRSYIISAGYLFYRVINETDCLYYKGTLYTYTLSDEKLTLTNYSLNAEAGSVTSDTVTEL